jgi:iron(III) transport system substrate-binding protein
LTKLPRLRRLYLALAALTIALPAAALDTSLLRSKAADRSQKLVAAATAEKELSLYTAFRPQDLQAVITPFEKKYGIKVKVWRSGSDNVMRRVITEAAGKRNEVDVVMITSPELEAVHREKLLQPVESPYFGDLLPGSVPAHKQWATVLMNVWVQAYNTSVIKKEDLPKSYQELADPKWKGKLGVEAKVFEWYTGVVRDMGEGNGVKLFNEIAGRNGVSVRLGMSLLNNMVVAGEVPLALAMYIDLPEKGKRAGQPIDWFALEPVMAMGFNVSVARLAPHPNAAALFEDYMLSPETQKLLSSLFFYPASTKAQSIYPKLNLKLIDPVFSVDTYDKWNKSYEDVVTKRTR